MDDDVRRGGQLHGGPHVDELTARRDSDGVSRILSLPARYLIPAPSAQANCFSAVFGLGGGEFASGFGRQLFDQTLA